MKKVIDVKKVIDLQPGDVGRHMRIVFRRSSFFDVFEVDSMSTYRSPYTWIVIDVETGATA